ncbi:MAG TPA: PDZ domain-containing protein [Hanamia sp.]|nr:PDZ domain-containing protein [Hanamia sp.]
MKTVILSAIFTACCGLFATNGFAQKEQSQLKKNEEIIIRKNGDFPSKTTIQIDGNDITINGKPLADYNGNVTILKRNFMGGDENNLFSPGQNLTVFGNSNTAFLGVLTAKTDKGAIIKNVIDESGAQKAGLKDDDIITQFGDKEITSPDDLRNAVQSYKPGDEVTMYYLRDGKKNSVKVDLGKSPNAGPMTYNMDSLRNIMGQYFRGNNNFIMPPMPGNQFYFHNNRQRLGIEIQDTENGNGAKILNVKQGSAAEKAGLKTGDIITQINGEKINDANDVRSQIMQNENKNDFKIELKRDNKDMNIEVHIPKVLNSINL